MGSVEWADGSRRALHRDAAWLAVALRWLPGTLIEQDVGVHYRCLVSEQAGEIAARFAEHGVGVRVLGRAHGAQVPVLRILAPLRHQRAAVLDGVRAVAGHRRRPDGPQRRARRGVSRGPTRVSTLSLARRRALAPLSPHRSPSRSPAAAPRPTA